MAQMYTKQWENKHGSYPSEIWVRLLSDVTQDQMRIGLVKLAKNRSVYAPDVLEFKELCLPEHKISPDGMNAEAYKIPAPKERQIENITQKEKREDAGNKSRSQILGLWGE